MSLRSDVTSRPFIVSVGRDGHADEVTTFETLNGPGENAASFAASIIRRWRDDNGSEEAWMDAYGPLMAIDSLRDAPGPFPQGCSLPLPLPDITLIISRSPDSEKRP